MGYQYLNIGVLPQKIKVENKARKYFHMDVIHVCVVRLGDHEELVDSTEAIRVG